MIDLMICCDFINNGYDGYDGYDNIEYMSYCFGVVWCVIVKVKNLIGFIYDLKVLYVDYQDDKFYFYLKVEDIVNMVGFFFI